MSEPTDRATRRRIPGLAWALLWLLGVEAAARALWSPAWVGRLAELEPGFDLGFTFTRPQCEPDGPSRITCRPTQYRPIARQSFARVKRPGTIRSFTFGGSHAAGASAYTSTLVRSLREDCGALRWEGINFAVKRHGSARILVAAQEALAHAPDLLILDFGGTNEFEDERDRDLRAQLHAGIWNYLFASHAVVLGRKLLTRRFPGLQPTLASGDDEDVASRDPTNRARWQRSIADNYGAVIALARARKIPVIVVGRASLQAHAPGSRELANHRLFLSLAGDGVLLFDAHAAFDAVDDRRRRSLFSGDRQHYSAAGQRLIAEGLAALILRDLPAARVCAAR